MQDIKTRVLSRKFLIAVLTIALACVNGDYTQAMTIAVAYIGVQGAIDHKSVQ